MFDESPHIESPWNISQNFHTVVSMYRRGDTDREALQRAIAHLKIPLEALEHGWNDGKILMYKNEAKNKEKK